MRNQFNTKGEASKWETEKKSQIGKGLFRPKSSKTKVSDLVDLFFAHLDERLKRKKRLGKVHRFMVESHIRNYIIGGRPFKRRHKTEVLFDKGLGNLPFNQVTPRRVEQFFDDILDTGLSKKTVSEIRNSLLIFMEYARRQEYIAINPVRGVTVIETKKVAPRRKITVPTKLLVRRLLEAADPWLRDAILFAALTGLRAGEQRALTWQDLDLNKGVVHVAKTLNRWNEDEGNGTKTAAGNREVPMPDILVQALRHKLVNTGGSATSLIFSASTRPLYTGRLNHLLSSLYQTVMAGWPTSESRPPRPRWHDLRHYAASTWIEARMDLKAVSTFIGHASIQTTMDIYGHLFETPEHWTAMDRIASSLFEGPAPVPDGTQMAPPG